MSTEITEVIGFRGSVALTQFGGGKERGVCLQVTVGNEYAQMEWNEAYVLGVRLVEWAKTRAVEGQTVIGQVEAPKVSSGNPLDVSKETAVEHLKNAQQVAAGLKELLEGKGLTALAGDVRAIYDRIERAREQIALGNVGR